MGNENLNLKTTINISGSEYDFHIINVENGILKRFILGKNEYIIVEQKPVNAEQKPVDPEQIKVEPEQILPEIEHKVFRSDNWNPKEDQILTEIYKKYTVRKIVEYNFLPGRSANAIQDRANFLRLKKYKTRKSRIDKKASINFNQKVLSNDYHNLVYEQCFNRIVFKLEDKENFTNKDLRKIIKNWYQDVLNQILKKSNIENYMTSYRQYGIDQGFFERSAPGLYKIPKIVKTIEEPKTTSGGPVKGFTEHKNMRIQEIRDNEKKFLKEHKQLMDDGSYEN